MKGGEIVRITFSMVVFGLAGLTFVMLGLNEVSGRNSWEPIDPITWFYIAVGVLAFVGIEFAYNLNEVAVNSRRTALALEALAARVEERTAEAEDSPQEEEVDASA